MMKIEKKWTVRRRFAIPLWITIGVALAILTLDQRPPKKIPVEKIREGVVDIIKDGVREGIKDYVEEEK